MSVGEAIAAARTRAGLSLETVADRTRIRRTVVAAIEKDDFSLCMGDVYARGHIRSIARVVGADPEPLVAQFDAEVAHPAASLLPGDGVDLVGGLERRSRPLNWSALLVASLVLVLAYGGWTLLRPGSSDGGRPVSQSQLPATATVVATPQASASAPAPSAPHASSSARATPAHRAGVSVSIAASRGPSWVRATSSGGTTLFEGMVAKGRTQQFTDRKQVTIVVGNAGAVVLTVNGKDVGPLGGRGQVASVAFGPTDPT
ncbi:cytoskeletal protein RodZ [Motilibacter peucedani]|uniref:Cytoskeletal protein RodZ n=1 Tax=Motilibacter peucedani TaxID=598650 RepID=A0A420XRF5_9ACTN|nr:helix-turn-helix domain-containing protein [Motilibacter peucedani]RKS77420.1 cytoskeletal protein RodZ [Motilibacter peucedani]